MLYSGPYDSIDLDDLAEDESRSPETFADRTITHRELSRRDGGGKGYRKPKPSIRVCGGFR